MDRVIVASTAFLLFFLRLLTSHHYTAVSNPSFLGVGTANRASGGAQE